MKIYSMTATFGKLNHASLTLEPGLNIIDAPNEWGKSTWCAFLIAMLYGIDTRQQNTKTTIADKERYRPWSGEPMSGRIELCWNGRDITIERSTRGRVPFGEFRAYETATGLEVPELTAANCGQELLGVERSVFTRAGFIRLQDMPVTQDESLRRRLNSLVTTGDESGDADLLGKHLKDLKNKVRYNRNGYLPQAEADRDQLFQQLQQREALQDEVDQLNQRKNELEQQIKLLQNHNDALRYEVSKQGLEQVREAQENRDRIKSELDLLESSVQILPAKEDAEKSLQYGQQLITRQKEQTTQRQLLPPAPVPPEIPQQYRGVAPEQAIAAAKEDVASYETLVAGKKKQIILPLIYAGLTAAAVAAMFILQQQLVYLIAGSAIALLGVLVIILTTVSGSKRKAAMEAITKKYPGITQDGWVSFAQRYAAAQQRYDIAYTQYRQVVDDMENKDNALQQELQSYTSGKPITDVITHWEKILSSHSLLTLKEREYQNAFQHAEAMESMVVVAPEPEFPDTLQLSAAETETQLQFCQFELQRLNMKLGQCQGQADTLGREDTLRARLDGINRRILRLNEHYEALELAQDYLTQATQALQRRFAPRISKKTQHYFSQLTDGRYQRLALSDDLSLSTAAAHEDTLRAVGCRSDGTIDQLYLSLRLAVAGEIMPDAPLVLDDALVRFDNTRLKTALALLQKEAENKQVILFSCHTRENEILGNE